jgi:hypothetical protein
MNHMTVKRSEVETLGRKRLTMKYVMVKMTATPVPNMEQSSSVFHSLARYPTISTPRG